MKIKKIELFNSLLLVPVILIALMTPSIAHTIKIPTNNIENIDLKIVSDEIPFGINMYLVDSKNLTVDYKKGNAIASMTVQDKKQKQFSADILFRLQDASSGGCTVTINGTVGEDSKTILTIDSTAHTKCDFGRINYSQASWLLNVEMRMD